MPFYKEYESEMAKTLEMYYANYTIGQIASKLNVSRGAIRKRLAGVKLRPKMGLKVCESCKREMMAYPHTKRCQNCNGHHIKTLAVLTDGD